MTTYYYETETGSSVRRLHAKDDTDAMRWMRDNFGDDLINVLIVYEEVSQGKTRTVWEK